MPIRACASIEVGRVKEFTPGKIKAGEGMEAKVKLELTYIMIENDGEEIIAIDKAERRIPRSGRGYAGRRYRADLTPKK